MDNTDSYMSEKDKQHLLQQLNRLFEENANLKDELTATKNLLKDTELKMRQLEQEKEHSERKDTKIDKRKSRNINLELISDDENHLNEDESVDTEQDPSVRIQVLHNLALKYASKGDFDVAVPLCNEALDALKKNKSYNHPSTATMLNILGLAYRDQNKIEEATNMLKEALDIREKSLGENHPSVAATLNILAILLAKVKKYKEAETLFKRALHIREKMLGKDHLDVAKQLNNLAIIYQSQGAYSESEKYYHRVLEIYKKALGPEDPVVKKAVNNLVACCLKQGSKSSV